MFLVIVGNLWWCLVIVVESYNGIDKKLLKRQYGKLTLSWKFKLFIKADIIISNEVTSPAFMVKLLASSELDISVY